MAPTRLVRILTAAFILVALWSTPAAQGVGAFLFRGSAQPVPEPATLMLFGSGLIAAGLAQSRRRKTPVPVVRRHRRSFIAPRSRAY